MSNAKNFLLSKTVWGIILAAATAMATIPVDTPVIGKVGMAAALLLALYGRVKAVVPIKLV